jgi:hypothetical protein
LRDSRIMIGFHEDHESTKPRKEPCSAATQPRDPLQRQLISPNDFVLSCFRDLCGTWPGASGGRLAHRAVPLSRAKQDRGALPRSHNRALYRRGSSSPPGIVPRDGKRGTGALNDSEIGGRVTGFRRNGYYVPGLWT